MPGAEPFSHDGRAVGVVVSHGFTGSPQTVRPWAEHLAAAGLSVRLPLLPGHGGVWRDLGQTSWSEWYAEVERAFLDLRKRCDHVFAMGLSMGGTLALRLAQVHGDAVKGLVVVNPSILMTRYHAIGINTLRWFAPSLPGIASDIRKPDVSEVAYDRVAPHGAVELRRLQRTVRSELASITQPMLVFRSAVDHVVPAASTAYLVRNVRTADLEEIVLANSFHVATLDHDAERILTGSVAFVRRIAGFVED